MVFFFRNKLIATHTLIEEGEEEKELKAKSTLWYQIEIDMYLIVASFSQSIECFVLYLYK